MGRSNVHFHLAWVSQKHCTVVTYFKVSMINSKGKKRFTVKIHLAWIERQNNGWEMKKEKLDVKEKD